MGNALLPQRNGAHLDAVDEAIYQVERQRFAEKLKKEQHKQAHLIDEKFESAEALTEKAETLHIFFESLHKLGRLLELLGHFLPPLKIILETISAGWEAIKNTFIAKTSSVSKTAKIGYAVTTLALTVIAFIFPPAAAVIFAASAGLATFKECLSLRGIITENNHAGRTLRAAKKNLGAVNYVSRSAQLRRVAELTRAKLKTRKKLIDNSFNTALKAASAIGFTLLVFPPTALIGAALLVGTAIIGAGKTLALPRLFRWMERRTERNIRKLTPQNTTGAEEKCTQDNKPQHTSTYRLAEELSGKNKEVEITGLQHAMHQEAPIAATAAGVTAQLPQDDESEGEGDSEAEGSQESLENNPHIL